MSIRNWILFPLVVRKNRSSGGIEEKFGYVRCKKRTAEFLDIEDKGKILGRGQRDRDAHTRTIVTPEGSTETIQVAESEVEIGIDIKNMGSKRIVLQTGQILKGASVATVNGRRVRRPATYRSLSMRFPGFASNKEISDFLASTIPTSKFGSGQNEITPFFKLPGGLLYPIMDPSVASGDQDARSGSEVENIQIDEQAVYNSLASLVSWR